MKLRQVTPEFVDDIPRGLEPGKLYVCCRYRAVKHLCACGCGAEINTPLHPTGWTLTCDGVSVSLSPSIGNWSEKCQSHYSIVNNRIQWAPRYTKRRILQIRRARDLELEEYFSANTKPKAGHREPVRLPIVTWMQRCLIRISHWISRRS